MDTKTKVFFTIVIIVTILIYIIPNLIDKSKAYRVKSNVQKIESAIMNQSGEIEN